MRTLRRTALALVLLLVTPPAQATYVNFESSHVHPIGLTPAGSRLLVVNTPDARLEVFNIAVDGSLTRDSSIPVGLEPVSVSTRLNAATGNEEAWVVNHLSDSVSIVDLALKRVIRTLAVGDEPTDLVFAQGKAFVAVSQEDLIRVFTLSNLTLPPATVNLFGRDVRALAVAPGGSKVYAVMLKSGNLTTVVDANVAFGNNPGLNGTRLAQLGLNTIACNGSPPPYPPLPPGITRNPALVDPPDGVPRVGLIVKFQGGACAGGPTPGIACSATAACGAGGTCTAKWADEIGQDWSHCLPFRLPDHDLFVVDAGNPTGVPVQTVDHLGTTLFEISVNPANGKVYVPNTDARNFVRFEHPLGVEGHMVDNRISVVDPGAGNSVVRIDLNVHIPIGCSNSPGTPCGSNADCSAGGTCIRTSDPATNLTERLASVSQPGMMVWRSDGSTAYLTAIGSRKLFVVDGACLNGSCIFGPDRTSPSTVEVGEGPTGVALHEGKKRLYVLLRFSNTIALVDSLSLTKLDEVPLHDPSPPSLRSGRRFLYDGIDSSGHGDAACSSCHISGDLDGLSWDLGNPAGDFVPYSTANDNVRFIVPAFGSPAGCDPAFCASHDGIDPQKGPMNTQTLRAMLEPLHWRGDRPTMRDFNKAFVGLMGKENVGTPANPAGLTPAQMDLFREFALGVRMPPNPHRNVNDSLPNALVQPPGSPFSGNPSNGEVLFNTHASDAGQPCTACHAHPFGAAGGQLGGVEPQEPASPQVTALFNGNADGSPHSDLEVPHLRNMYEKFGPRFGPPGTLDPPESKTGLGFIHDGAIPDLGTFLSANVFNLTAVQARDIATFMFFFPTGTKPAVGKQVTVPPGAPVPGPDETLLSTLLGVGNLADGNHHCELVAAAPSATRLRTYYLDGTSGAEELWTTDLAGEPQVSTTALRSGATGPITFLCAPPGEGIRLGADLDEDVRLNGDDCAPADGGAWAPAAEATNLVVGGGAPTHLSWDSQASAIGPGVVYQAVGGDLDALHASGLAAATGCLSGDLTANGYDDTRPDPAAGEGYFYLVRAMNSCASGGFGAGRDSLNALACP